MCHVSQSRIKNFKASFKVIFIGFGRRKTSGSSSFTNTRNIFTFVDKRNKTTINGNEIKHNERNKKVYKMKTNLYLRALLLTNPTKLRAQIFFRLALETLVPYNYVHAANSYFIKFCFSFANAHYCIWHAIIIYCYCTCLFAKLV
jgi:hypothetical protein